MPDLPLSPLSPSPPPLPDAIILSTSLPVVTVQSCLLQAECNTHGYSCGSAYRAVHTGADGRLVKAQRRISLALSTVGVSTLTTLAVNAKMKKSMHVVLSLSSLFRVRFEGRYSFHSHLCTTSFNQSEKGVC